VTGNVDCGFGYVSCLASQFVEYTSEIGCRLYSCTWLFNRRHPISTRTISSFIVLSLTFCVCNIWIFVSNFHSSVTRVVHCLFLARQPPVGQGLLIPEVPRSHTTTYHIRQDLSGRVISLAQRSLPDNTQHSQQTSMPPVVLEPTISVGERPQTYALYRSATGNGVVQCYVDKLDREFFMKGLCRFYYPVLCCVSNIIVDHRCCTGVLAIVGGIGTVFIFLVRTVVRVALVFKLILPL
jgi:hypothetical protein